MEVSAQSDQAARPEFSIRAVVVGILVATFVGLMYPYIVLKIGFGPNISVVAAFAPVSSTAPMLSIALAPRNGMLPCAIRPRVSTSNQ